MKIFTIGHSNHSIDKLIGLLETNGVLTVVDVRTAPYSRYSPQFNKEDLEAAILQHTIRYVFAGKYLGGRPPDPSCYKGGTLPAEGANYLHKVDYAEVMKRDWFVKGIERLLELADQQPTAILCSEEDPAKCHRHHLIAKYMMANHPDARVEHIRGEGTVFGADTILTYADKSSVTEHPGLKETNETIHYRLYTEASRSIFRAVAPTRHTASCRYPCQPRWSIIGLRQEG